MEMPDTIWKAAWSELYKCFGERMQQEELDLMDSVLHSVEQEQSTMSISPNIVEESDA